MPTSDRPILIYAANCGFCAIWVNYWRRLTGERITYAPAEEVAAQYPAIAGEQFKHSVWLVYPDGTRASGARAVFELMGISGRARLLWIYRNIPGFAVAAEAFYRLVGRHRKFAYGVTRILWGTAIEPASYCWARALFLRGLALVYLIAFLSLVPQIVGLVGVHGILPIHDYLQEIQSQLGASRYQVFPTLAWMNSSDAFLRAMCWGGSALAAILLIGILPLPAAIGLYALYLSVDLAGQDFLSFQWDALLLETGFAAILLAPRGLRPKYARPPSDIGRWVLRFLLFRLMFESGLVKLLSGDPTWRSLTALDFHFETQPLPTPLAWYAHQLPAGFHKLSVAAVFAVELVVPFLFFMPRRLRILAGWITIIFQLLIAATGNYTFFNLLTIVLAISMFDDAHLRALVPARLQQRDGFESGARSSRVWSGLAKAAGGVLIVVGVFQLASMLAEARPPGPIDAIVSEAEMFRVVNRYGLFAVMTTSRPEIIIEGSNDGQNWQAYEFKFKPGNVQAAPHWVAPYQPRLDWQMWFAALTNPPPSWFTGLMVRLLEGSSDVLRLLDNNPFPNSPPRFVRASVYVYHFSGFATRRSTGAWWTRQYRGDYFPAVSLR